MASLINAGKGWPEWLGFWFWFRFDGLHHTIQHSMKGSEFHEYRGFRSEPQYLTHPVAPPAYPLFWVTK